MLLCYGLTLVGWEKRKGRVRARKFVGWTKGGLISKGEVEEKKTSGAKAVTHHIPWVDQFPGSPCTEDG